MAIAFRPSVQPFQPNRPRLNLDNHLKGIAKTAVHWDTRVPANGWPMDGNDQYGDCVWAAIGHGEQLWSNNATVPTVQQLLAGYSAVTGFNPNDPNTDQGTVIADALAYWRKTGVANRKVELYASINPQNANVLQQAVEFFGGLNVGIDFPASAMTQFNNNQPWTVVQGSPIEGGHCVLIVGYDANYLYVVTWGKVQKMAWSFWNKYGSEAWAIISRDWLDSTGKTPEGLDLYGLGQDFTSLTGQPNPFPAPSPTPAPTGPTPLPTAPVGPTGSTPPAPTGTTGTTGPVNSADTVLFNALSAWSNLNHFGVNLNAANAFKVWAKAKGFIR